MADVTISTQISLETDLKVGMRVKRRRSPGETLAAGNVRSLFSSWSFWTNPKTKSPDLEDVSSAGRVQPDVLQTLRVKPKLRNAQVWAHVVAHLSPRVHRVSERQHLVTIQTLTHEVFTWRKCLSCVSIWTPFPHANTSSFSARAAEGVRAFMSPVDSSFPPAVWLTSGSTPRRRRVMVNRAGRAQKHFTLSFVCSCKDPPPTPHPLLSDFFLSFYPLGVRICCLLPIASRSKKRSFVNVWVDLLSQMICNKVRPLCWRTLDLNNVVIYSFN